MPSASNYTNKVRFAASVKNTKAQLQNNVGNLTQSSLAGCGLDIDYKPIEYVEICNIRQPYSKPKERNPPNSLYIDSITWEDATVNLSSPYGVTVDSENNIYISDTVNNKVYKLTSGTITTFAGTGVSGQTGDGFPAIDATLNSPNDITFNTLNNTLYIADTNNNKIRSVSSENINLFAGTGSAGFGGDYGPAVSSQLGFPSGIAYDNLGNVYIADVYNHKIRKVDTDQIISTIAGNGSPVYNGDTGIALDISLNTPNGLAIDSSNNLYITEYNGNRLRKLNLETGIITTILGDGVSDIITKNLSGVAIDSSNNIYVTDSGMNRVIKINKITSQTSICAGIGIPGFSGDKQLAVYSQLNSPNGIAVDSIGNIYIADTGNNRIRKLYYV